MDLAKRIKQTQRVWMQEERPAYWLEPTSCGLYTLDSRDERGIYYYHGNYNP